MSQESRLTAVSDIDTEMPSDDVELQIQAAEKEYLEARSTYLLSTSIMENVLMVDPILKAIHSGPNATSVERSYTLCVGLDD